MANPIFVLDISPSGIVATHQAGFELPVFVAPTPEEKRQKHFNTIRPNLITIGCFRLFDEGFAFDSSFIDPGAENEFTNFAELMFKLRELDKDGRFPPITIFGHTDPSGDELYNKRLSGRRARAVYSLLIRKVEIWETLFSNREGVAGDEWGLKSIQHMLRTLGGPIPFHQGPVDGGATPETRRQTREGVIAFQASKGIVPPTGVADKHDPVSKATRQAMFSDYMDAICHLKNRFRFKLEPDRDFLCRNKDKAGKGDLQGCGEYNPQFLLSLTREKELSKEERDDFYRDDRRVVVYIFKHGSEIDPVKWPCPRATEDLIRNTAIGCDARFWSDGRTRRMLKHPTHERHFTETEDTFACRWYHGFAVNSPCENLLKLWVIRLQVDGSKPEPEPLANRAFVIIDGETEYAPVMRGFTNERGEIRIPVFDESARMKLKIDFFAKTGPPPQPPASSDEGFDSDKFTGEEDFLEITLDCGSLKPPEGKIPARQRLYNLGFGSGKSVNWNDDEESQAVKGFQRIYGKKHGIDTPTGEMDEKTQRAIFDEHEKSPLQD